MEPGRDIHNRRPPPFLAPIRGSDMEPKWEPTELEEQLLISIQSDVMRENVEFALESAYLRGQAMGVIESVKSVTKREERQDERSRDASK